MFTCQVCPSFVLREHVPHRHDNQVSEGMKKTNRRQDSESGLAQGDIVLLYFIPLQNAATPSASPGKREPHSQYGPHTLLSVSLTMRAHLRQAALTESENRPLTCGF